MIFRIFNLSACGVSLSLFSQPCDWVKMKGGTLLLYYWFCISMGMEYNYEIPFSII